jgi:hypothetical protein
MTPFSYEPRGENEHFAKRVMDAVRAEFAGDEQMPRFVVVIETPPDGDVAIASSGDDAADTLRLTFMGSGVASRGVREGSPAWKVALKGGPLNEDDPRQSAQITVHHPKLPRRIAVAPARVLCDPGVPGGMGRYERVPAVRGTTVPTYEWRRED